MLRISADFFTPPATANTISISIIIIVIFYYYYYLCVCLAHHHKAGQMANVYDGL